MTRANPSAEAFALTTSRGFADWLAGTGGSPALTTCQAGKLLVLGLKPDGGLSVFERTFRRVMGMGVSPDGASFALAIQVQILRLDDVMAGQGAGPPGGVYQGADAVYAPQRPG